MRDNALVTMTETYEKSMIKKFTLCLLPMLLVGFMASADARQKRSYKQRQIFAYTHACPSTHLAKLPCPGYIIDHVNPLCKGGPDLASNMQWQTIAEAKAKDKWECKT